MPNLTRASDELFRRTPDECFSSVQELATHCYRQRRSSREVWKPPLELAVRTVDKSRLVLEAGDDGTFHMNDWSFSQLCRLAAVGKETVNRLSVETASDVFRETLPRGDRPLQLFTEGTSLRSIHAASYTRLYNSELLSVIQEYATDFEPAQAGIDGKTGLYAGQQDLFCFLIDPAGWTEIGDQAFAPGFFVWNSEVGSRSIGIETFWVQAVCRNHVRRFTIR